MLHLQGLGEPAIARCLSIQRIEPKFESWQSVEAAFLSEVGQTWRGPGGGARFKEFVKSHGGRCHTPGVRAAVRDLASSGAPVEDLHAQGLLLKSLDNAQLTRSGFGDHAFQADRVGSLKPLKIKSFQVSNQPHGGEGGSKRGPKFVRFDSNYRSLRLAGKVEGLKSDKQPDNVISANSPVGVFVSFETCRPHPHRPSPGQKPRPAEFLECCVRTPKNLSTFDS